VEMDSLDVACERVSAQRKRLELTEATGSPSPAQVYGAERLTGLDPRTPNITIVYVEKELKI